MQEAEIKEINIPNDILAILGDLTNGAMNYYKNPKVIELKYNLLLDYITNLQEENEYSNHCNEELRKKITNLEYKIERLENELKEDKKIYLRRKYENI